MNKNHTPSNGDAKNHLDVVSFNEWKTAASELAKQHISIQSYHRLNRSSAVASNLHLELFNREVTGKGAGMAALYVPYLFSYISEDIKFVLEELKEKGLCDDFLSKSK